MISTDRSFLPLLAHHLDYVPSPLATCIVDLDNEGAPVAGVVFDCYNGATIHAHIWVGRKPSRHWYWFIFAYPFRQLKVNKIIGQVNSNNQEARKLDEHFGFSLEATISGYYPAGDLLVYTMREEQCRILNSRAWARLNGQIEGAK